MSGRGRRGAAITTTARFWLGKKRTAGASPPARNGGGAKKRHREAPRVDVTGGGDFTQGTGDVTQGIGGGGGGTQDGEARPSSVCVCPVRLGLHMLAMWTMYRFAGAEHLSPPVRQRTFAVVTIFLENVFGDMVAHDIGLHDALRRQGRAFDLFRSIQLEPPPPPPHAHGDGGGEQSPPPPHGDGDGEQQ